MTKTAPSPAIVWDFGTAYELFTSLHVMLEPDYFGIRPSYAASVRARVPAEERKFLEEFYALTGVPLPWLSELPAPKDAISALWALKQVPPAQRMDWITRWHKMHDKTDAEAEKYKTYREILDRVSSEGKYTSADADFFVKILSAKKTVKRETVESVLYWWSHPAELGEMYLSSIQSYYTAFFEEEEKRIEPVLRAGLERAQDLANRLSFTDLFNELSQGLHVSDDIKINKFILAPAFWSTPLVFFEKLDANTMLLLFGTRPADMSAIPGETVPDALVRSLKALADPTRLKILHYLTHENLTPSEIARKLQLRPPTVTHHLKELRLAGLVEFGLMHEENRYTIRRQALESIYQNLDAFLEGESIKETA